jgi:hypothetical protein
MRVHLFISLFVWFSTAQAQFDPAGGLTGSKAIHYTNGKIKGWTTNIEVKRGWQNMADTGLGKPTNGTPSSALGIADGIAVSLGDRGSAIITVTEPLKDLIGPEFAVFENGFKASTAYFLEFGFVEVSSDGINYFGFETESLHDTTLQFTNSSELNPEKIKNLAGKHQVFYGTPFDLAEIPDTVLLNKSNVKYIRITDVVGSLDYRYSSRDSKGRKINDPWPTAFATGGFDLDALAILSPGYSGIDEAFATDGIAYPNPVLAGEKITLKKKEPESIIRVFDLHGRLVSQINKIETNFISAPMLPGVYLLEVVDDLKTSTMRLCVY